MSFEIVSFRNCFVNFKNLLEIENMRKTLKQVWPCNGDLTSESFVNANTRKKLKQACSLHGAL